MSRTNVTTWQDGETITRMMSKLQEAIVRYQPYSLVDPNTGKPYANCLGGDSGVIVESIELRNRLNNLIEKSRKANG